ncbi:MAG: molybdopterin molybdotransferase MoeA [Phycisphaerae bacterium]|nr:molybdopterin molybdotransferase MoeA [Phycisphaerae bacterium]
MIAGHLQIIWGKDRHRLLSVEEAWDRIAAEVTPVGVTPVSLGEATGRVLAGPVAAVDDSPPFDKALMDGFAVRSADCATADVGLRVLGSVPAGEAPSGLVVGPGEAMQINTGAPVPPGADAVVVVEETTPSSDVSSVRIHNAVRPGQNIAGRGSDCRAGDIVLTPPLRMEAPQMAAAASAGARSVDVYREVGAAIVVTGDELVPVGENKGQGQIFESNGGMLAALLRQFGAEPCQPTLARDTVGELRSRFAEAMTQPVVIAVGGMSMGTLDLVPRVLAELGVRWLLHGVAIRPGRPVAYGRGPAGQHVFGLPGNPVSAFVCAWLFVRMVIAGLHGFVPQPPRRWRATLATALNASGDPRPAFLPARVWNDAQQGMMADPCKWRGSADPFTLAAANALLVWQKPTDTIEAGRAVEVILTSKEA